MEALIQDFRKKARGIWLVLAGFLVALIIIEGWLYDFDSTDASRFIFLAGVCLGMALAYGNATNRARKEIDRNLSK